MKLSLIEKRIENSETKTFIFKPEKKIKWIAGQYLIYFLPHENQDNRGKMRFFTISSSPFEKYPSITTKIIDKSSSFKKALDNLQINDEIEAKGPDGDFILDKLSKNHVFIAGGIGITPFNSILKQLSFEKKQINATLFFTSKKNFVFKDTIDKIQKENRKLKVFYLNERINEDILRKNLKNLNKYIYYVSGSDPMVEELEILFKRLGIPDKNLKFDYFSGYKNV